MIGDKNFSLACQEYFKLYEWKNTTRDIFINLLNKHCDKDMTKFSNDWICKQGLNSIRININKDSNNLVTNIEIIQEHDSI